MLTFRCKIYPFFKEEYSWIYLATYSYDLLWPKTMSNFLGVWMGLDGGIFGDGNVT